MDKIEHGFIYNMPDEAINLAMKKQQYLYVGNKPRYIYIAGPYSGGDTVLNVRNAVLAAEELIKLELIPYIPHLTMFWHLIAPHDYQFWLDYDLKWLDKCDGLLRLPGDSNGADAEVEYAKEMEIPVYYSIEELK